jgi:membrane fusion protein (multidrug efflux system)
MHKSMKTLPIVAIISGAALLFLSGCESLGISQDVAESGSEATAAYGAGTHRPQAHGEAGHHEHRIVVTSPVRKDVISTQQYVCQIHSCQHIEVRALERGYLEEVCVKEGQGVKKGELMFKLLPTLYQAKLDSEQAELQKIQIELDNAQSLAKKGYVSPQEIALKTAELAKANANLALARAELSFASVKAPFTGIVDRQRNQLGSLIEEGDILTTLSDNSTMWVYFNVPEARYLEYKADLDKDKTEAAGTTGHPVAAGLNGADQHQHLQIELKLANGQIFAQQGKIGAIEADFNNTTGNIAFRADFPNPDGLLRNGQTGTILIHNTLQNAVVIPQRATFEILAKQYVYVVDQDNVVHQRDITVQVEQDDIFVVESGLEEGDKIILEGIRQVRDGDKVEYDFQSPEEALSNLKFHAE